jgi:RimJ/RimL family protein N-acetyltransferase
MREAVAWIEAWPNRWREETSCGWAVTGDDHVLGQIAFRTIDLHEGTAELSYWVLPEARGRGVAQQAVAGTDELVVRRAGTSSHRDQSLHPERRVVHVAGRAGYVFEGVKRSQVLHPDGWHDMHQHARIATDPR